MLRPEGAKRRLSPFSDDDEADRRAHRRSRLPSVLPKSPVGKRFADEGSATGDVGEGSATDPPLSTAVTHVTPVSSPLVTSSEDHADEQLTGPRKRARLESGRSEQAALKKKKANEEVTTQTGQSFVEELPG